MSKKEKGTSMHIRRTAGDRVFETAVIILFLLFTVICIFPFYYLLINTISDNDLVTSGRVNFFPLLKDAAVFYHSILKDTSFLSAMSHATSDAFTNAHGTGQATCSTLSPNSL